ITPRPHPLVSSLFQVYRPHRDLHSFPTRRSSDLRCRPSRSAAWPGPGGGWRPRSSSLLTLDVGANAPRQSSRLSHIAGQWTPVRDRKSTRLNSSHVKISYAVFCLKKQIENLNLLS